MPRLIFIPECESTQDEAFARIEKAEALPFVISCGLQTKGRGRRGRKWEAEPENSLSFSCALRSQKRDLSGLSLVVGLALIEALSNFPLEVKWPNDLMLKDKKIGGILIETRIHSSFTDIVIGVGLNQYSFGSYSGLETKLSLEALVEHIYEAWLKFEAEGFSSFKSRFEEKLWRRNQFVEFQTEDGIRQICVLGVDESGALITDNDGRLELQATGEIIYEENLVC